MIEDTSNLASEWASRTFPDCLGSLVALVDPGGMRWRVTRTLSIRALARTGYRALIMMTTGRGPSSQPWVWESRNSRGGGGERRQAPNWHVRQVRHGRGVEAERCPGNPKRVSGHQHRGVDPGLRGGGEGTSISSGVGGVGGAGGAGGAGGMVRSVVRVGGEPGSSAGQSRDCARHVGVGIDGHGAGRGEACCVLIYVLCALCYVCAMCLVRRDDPRNCEPVNSLNKGGGGGTVDGRWREGGRGRSAVRAIVSVSPSVLGALLAFERCSRPMTSDEGFTKKTWSGNVFVK